MQVGSWLLSGELVEVYFGCANFGGFGIFIIAGGCPSQLSHSTVIERLDLIDWRPSCWKVIGLFRVSFTDRVKNFLMEKVSSLKKILLWSMSDLVFLSFLAEREYVWFTWSHDCWKASLRVPLSLFWARLVCSTFLKSSVALCIAMNGQSLPSGEKEPAFRRFDAISSVFIDGPHSTGWSF